MNLSTTPEETCCAPGCCDDSAAAQGTVAAAPEKSAVQADQLREQVRQHYGGIVEKEEYGCAPGCCGGTEATYKPEYSKKLGYTDKDLAVVPEAANYGLGCGNPILAAKLQPGEVVVDLGSGAGIDCFLAAKQVTDTGRVIGIDMTPVMISKARQNAAENGFDNVEFRLGEIEHMPLADQSVDVVISNCVVNLSPNQQQVFHECFRVLKPGGRIAISDIVATAEFPAKLREDAALFCGCMSGASHINTVKAMVQKAGFTQIELNPKENSREIIHEWAPDLGIEDVLCSVYILAVKP